MLEKLLINVASLPEAGILQGILEEAGIPYYTVTPGPGAIYAASVTMGVKLYVAEEDHARAAALIEGVLDAPPAFLDFPDADEEN